VVVSLISGQSGDEHRHRGMPQLPSPALAGLLAAGLLLCGSAAPAHAVSLEDIRQLENLINATGTETLVSDHCPPNHAGYYENDGESIDRLVICRRNVDMGDIEAVWEVMAHEATHIMQACTGTTAIADALMPRTYRELQSLAPHYAKLISSEYRSSEQRLEAEAFWMELQTPPRVMELFRHNCAAFLQQDAPRNTPANTPQNASQRPRPQGLTASPAQR